MKTALRFITCGSVDDGKSSLIGRLLLESRQIFDDQLKSIEKDSRKYGTQGDAPDLALLVDGLQAEREQGITIDVAYRFFQTPHRRFIVADTPGHEQYTRNMATAASTAQVAVVLIDARKGVLVQTRRHSRIAAMLGIRHIVLAINKMDLVDWREEVYAQIAQSFRSFATTLDFSSIDAIPLSALKGDNVVSPGTAMAWYRGPTLLGLLENLVVDSAPEAAPLRMPVQLVNRPNADFRGFCGRIASGTARVGDAVRVNGKGVSTRIQSIVVYGTPLTEAQAGASITLTLSDEVDVSRGDVIGAAGNTREPADQLQAHVIWMSEQPLIAGRAYFLKIHTQTVGATVTAIRHQIDVNTGAHLAAKNLQLNEIAVVNISLDRKVMFTPYRENRVLGGFIMIDRLSNATMGAGMVDFELRRASNLHWQALAVDKARRSHMKSQRPLCIWLTGLSGAGKSTLANQLEKRLHAEGRHTYLLDGDNLRHGLNRDLGFVEADRAENIRRVAEVAKLMVEAGLVVIVSLISPYRVDRERARSLFGPKEFVEVYVDASLAECEKRDPKGLYAKARRGEVKNFTGIDSQYEPPETPELHLNTIAQSSEECVDRLLHTLGPMLSPLDLPPTD